MLRHASQRQPLLVMVENLHWIDPTSHEFLTEVVERLGSVPLLLLVTFRPGYRPPWMEKSYATQLALPPLGPADSRRVVQAVLDPAPVPEPLMQGLLTKAAGNPLFLEELAWTVREHGHLQLPPEVPETIRAVLAARIDRLPPEAKQVLQTAAVIGTEVPLPLLQAIAAVPEATLHRSLAHLHAAEFLAETRLFPTPTWTFKHALIHEVAYSSLLQAGRRMLHARIVEAIEALAGDRVTEQGDTPGASCPAGRGVGQSRHLLPAGWRQGQRPRRVPRGGGRLRAGPPGPRAPARAPRHPGAGHRAPPRVGRSRCAHWASMGGASPCWARPRPWPGRSTIGPGW